MSQNKVTHKKTSTYLLLNIMFKQNFWVLKENIILEMIKFTKQ